MRTRIMYIEYKNSDLIGIARIGKVRFSKTMKSVHYFDKQFTKFQGYKSNHIDIETGEEYWISGCRKDGSDRLHGENLPIHIDEDIREEYWLEIRELPNRVGEKVIKGKNNDYIEYSADFFGTIA